MTTILEPPEPAGRETFLDRLQQNRTTILIAVGCVLGTGLLVRTCAAPPAASSSNVPQVLSGPTTTTTAPPPPIDPLANLGQLGPTAAALVGPEWDARRELARRASEVMTQTGRDQCALLIGATIGGSWELSITYGPAHPAPVFAGCPWPPPTSTTTTTGATP